MAMTDLGKFYATIQSIVGDALSSAIPEPWEVSQNAADRIMDALKPEWEALKRERDELQTLADRLVHRDRIGNAPAARPDLVIAAEEALIFLEDEAENRSAAGSSMSDYEREPREIADRLRDALSADDDVPATYGDWTISYDPPPIPFRGLDYTYTHKDYDGAPDSGDRRCGYAGSVDECKADIDEIEAEAAEALAPNGSASALRPDQSGARS